MLRYQNVKFDKNSLYVKRITIHLYLKYHKISIMKKVYVVMAVLAVFVLVGASSCKSVKPCPAYTQVESAEVKA